MNPTITLPGQPQMQAQVILASTTDLSPPIYTIRMRYPRIIHSEFMTHRVFGRNAGSSRARPAKVTIQEARDNPFIPWHWGKNQAGMQAGEESNSTVRVQIGEYNDVFDDGTDEVEREKGWLWACDKAVEAAEAFANAGYHKQIFNRLLEPFSWIDVLATGTEWQNFLWLRDHEDAEPHIRDLAVLVKQAMDSAHMQELEPGDWHLPYVGDEDRAWADSQLGGRTDEALLCKVSAARCARISYTPFDSDKADIGADLQLYDKLMGSDRVHASPLEHQATPDILDPHGMLGRVGPVFKNPHLHGNLTGWIQHRKLVPGENHTGPA